MQTASSRIWAGITVSISYDPYTNKTFKFDMPLKSTNQSISQIIQSKCSSSYIHDYLFPAF